MGIVDLAALLIVLILNVVISIQVATGSLAPIYPAASDPAATTRDHDLPTRPGINAKRRTLVTDKQAAQRYAGAMRQRREDLNDHSDGSSAE